MRDRILCATLVVVGCAIITGVLYWQRCKRWQGAWGRIPTNEWEQLASRIKYGPQTPLDSLQILADLDDWLCQ